jgi:hypothetical protein
VQRTRRRHRSGSSRLGFRRSNSLGGAYGQERTLELDLEDSIACAKLSGMRVSELIRAKADKLLTEAPRLYMRASEFDGMDARREAWVASARQLIELLTQNPASPYRSQVQSTLINAIGMADNRVDNIAAILRQLVIDVDDGLLNPMESKFKASFSETFWITRPTISVADIMHPQA